MQTFFQTKLRAQLLAIIVSGFVLLCGGATLVRAADFVVDTVADAAALSACTVAADDCSLRGALSVANNNGTNDTITFDTTGVFSTPQTIRLTLGELQINNSGTLAINGTGANNRLIISGNNASRVFSINEGASVTLTAMRIARGNGVGAVESGAGGGIYSNNAALTLVGIVVTDNTAFVGGGILSIGGTLDLTNAAVVNNTMDLVGGGILKEGGNLTILNSTVSANTLTGMSSGGSGAGIFNTGTAVITNSNVDFNGNPAGGSFFQAALGGGIFNSGALTITNTTLRNNRGGDGGGILNNSEGTLNVVDSNVLSNTADRSGGGIYMSGGTLNLLRSSVNNNNSQGLGGGIAFPTGTIVDSTISGNRANDGGGIYGGASLTLTNSTIGSNRASRGGGIHNAGDGVLSLVNATIALNAARVEGGGVYNSSNNNTVEARNSIIAQNTTENQRPAVSFAPDFSGTLNSKGNNLISNTSGANVTGDTTGDLLNINPQLDPQGLQNNGGSTLTM